MYGIGTRETTADRFCIRHTVAFTVCCSLGLVGFYGLPLVGRGNLLNPFMLWRQGHKRGTEQGIWTR